MPRLQPLYDAAPPTLRNVVTSARGYVLSRMRYCPLFWKELDAALEREKGSAEEIEDYQNACLRDVVSHAFLHVPYYRRLFSEQGLHPSDIRTVGDLPLLPVLTRETVRSCFRELISDDVPYGETVRVFTSGTTGSGLPVVYDKEALVRDLALAERQRSWAGISPREWRITLFGARVVPPGRLRPPFWVYNLFEKQILMSIFHLSPACMPDYISFLSSHSGIPLEGFPTVLSVLADFVLETKAAIPMKAVFTNGEPLSPEARAKICKAFDCRVYDSYGMTEWAGLIQECEKGGYHLASDYGILEVLDEDGERLPAGREGYLVWTGLINRAMPFIRYRIGDKGMWDELGACQCGRPFPLVSPTITRDSDYLVTADGMIFSPRAINQVLKDKTAFAACQFIQHDSHNVEIRVVPANEGATKEAEAVRRSLERILAGRLSVTVRFAEEPLQRASGKMPLIVSPYTNKPEEVRG